MLHSRFRDIHRAVLVSHGEDLHSLLLSVDLKLPDRRRTVHVTGRQKHLPSLNLILSRQLRRRSGLTGSLQTGHHNDCDLIGRTQLNLRSLTAHETDHLFMDDLDHSLPRRQALQHFCAHCPGLHRLYELFDYLEAHIRLQERQLHFLQRRFHIRLRQPALAPQVLEYVL